MFCANFLISSIFSTCFPTIFTTFIHTWLYWYYYKFKTMWTWWLVFIPLERYRYWNCAKHYHAVVQYTFQRLWWFVVDYGNYIDTDWTSTCPTAGFIFHNCTSKNLPILDKDTFVDRQTDRHTGKKPCPLKIYTDFQFKSKHQFLEFKLVWIRHYPWWWSEPTKKNMMMTLTCATQNSSRWLGWWRSSLTSPDRKWGIQWCQHLACR